MAENNTEKRKRGSSWADSGEIFLEFGKIKLPWLPDGFIALLSYRGSFRGLCVIYLPPIVLVIILILSWWPE